MTNTEKIVFISTAGIDTPERATLPFVIATAALTVDVEVIMVLQAGAVMLAKKGMAEHIQAPGLMPMKKLISDFIEFGGKVLVCSPCLKERNVNPEDMIEGAQVVAAATVVDEILSAKSTVTY
ncbi:MAG: DsrE/DsrF-like family protein [Bacteroidetes bacterium ADurb.BinA174]|nr:MAG: DsrE/DsrF-like family protein [Bacteroidetes bacterium ADurb.BinA174]